MSFFLSPLLVTAVAYIFIIYVRYQRERDIIKMLPYLIQPSTLITLVAIFSLTTLLKAILHLLS